MSKFIDADNLAYVLDWFKAEVLNTILLQVEVKSYAENEIISMFDNINK